MTSIASIYAYSLLAKQNSSNQSLQSIEVIVDDKPTTESLMLYKEQSKTVDDIKPELHRNVPTVVLNSQILQSTKLTQTPPTKTKSQIDRTIPNWDCKLFYCNEGDPKIYPLRASMAQALTNATAFELTSDLPNAPVSMVVIFDPTCPECKRFYRETITEVLHRNGNVKIIPTIYSDNLSVYKLREVQKMLCASDLDQFLHNIANRLPTAKDYDCKVTVDDARKIVGKTKELLTPFGVAGATPLTLTKTSNWLGFQPYKNVVKHINP